jgi:hypothetical protein
MFNDESASVRYNAVSKLVKLNKKWSFSVSDDLIDSIVLLLHDTDIRVRSFAYVLVQDLHFKSIDRLDQIIELMIKMTTKRPNDTNLIYEALAKIGQRHSQSIGTSC